MSFSKTGEALSRVLPFTEFRCIKCGNCCRSRAIDITFSDILRWDKEERWDILCEISYIDNYPSKGQGGFYIEKSLKKKEDMDRHCPFLKDNECSIHDTKPSGCSDAPLSYREFDECPVFVKPSDYVIDMMIEKQTKDIVASKKYSNIVMGILIKARKWLN